MGAVDGCFLYTIHFRQSSYYHSEKLIIHSLSIYTDLDQQVPRTAANGKATHCKQTSFRNRKCIHTEKSTLRGFSPWKQPSEAGGSRWFMPILFLQFLLQTCTFMIIHLKRSRFSGTKNKSQEGRGGMSTSGKYEILSEAVTDNRNVIPAQTTIPFDTTGLKPLIDNNTSVMKWRELEREETITGCPHFLWWKIKL